MVMTLAATDGGKRRRISTFALLGLMAGLLVAVQAPPAQAADHGHGRQAHQERGRHDDRARYRLHSYGAPAYAYAPPPVYYAPPPGPPVLDFVFPLRFR